MFLPRCLRHVAIALLAAAVTGCGSSDEKPDEPPAFDPGPGYPYEVLIKGAPDEAFEELLNGALRIYTLAERAPASLSRLRHRVEDDLDFVERALRAEGYLQGAVSYEIVPPEKNTPPPQASLDAGRDEERGSPPEERETKNAATEARAKVVLYLAPKERFKFGALNFEPAEIEGGPAFPNLESLGFVVGDPARAAVVVETEKKLIRWLQDQGRPHAHFVKREVSASTDTLEMKVLSIIDPGPALTMDAPDFAGLEAVEQAYLETYVNWEPGDRASRTVLNTYQQRLYRTGLFDAVAVSLPKPDEPESSTRTSATDGQVPVTVTTRDALPRSVTTGVTFSTVEGFGVEGSLEHRNLFGSNETGRFEADIAGKDQRLGVTYIKPQYLLHDQKFRASAIALHEDDDAFTVRALKMFVGLERRLSKALTVSGNVGAEYAEVTDVPIPGTSRLVLAPLTASYDGSDNTLDPSAGYKINALVTPAVGTFKNDPLFFTTVDLTASTYWAFGDAQAPHVLALRGRLGSLLGASRDDVPAHRRLFAGGGGSVRAYDRRYVGPFDNDGDPLGGRSVAEVGLEFRARFGENLGIVPFIEAGSVSEAEYPDFAESVQAGYGLGIRYYTPIGPMRADIAFPINRREVDDAFQFYISIGQAF